MKDRRAVSGQLCPDVFAKSFLYKLCGSIQPSILVGSDGGGALRPLPGLHFGSLLIEAADDQRTYQMIPHSWIDRIRNRADFLERVSYVVLRHRPSETT